MNIIGIDPGLHGGIAVMDSKQNFVIPVGIAKMTEQEVSQHLRSIKQLGQCHCYIEKVAAARKQGVKSMFTFGQNYGFYKGMLVAMQIPYEEVPPMTWQAGLKIKFQRAMSYQDHKKLLRQKAQQLFPSVAVLADTADALLIAEYGRRVINSRSSTKMMT